MKPLEVAKIETDRSGVPSDLGTNGTFGLDRRLSNLAAWAVRHDVISPLLQVLEASDCGDTHAVYAGTVLSYLRHPGVYTCLQDWTAERPFIYDIKRLVDACSVSPEIFRRFPPMPREQAASRQLIGRLSKVPVVALVARPVDSTLKDQGAWLEIIRAWCFVQHLDAVYAGRTVDKYLAMVTDKIRLAVDRGVDWQDFVYRLEGPKDTFHGLTQHLAVKSVSLLESREEKAGMSPIQREFLGHLRDLCTKRSATDTETSPGGRLGLFQRYLRDAPRGGLLSRSWEPDRASSDIDSESRDVSQPLGVVNFDPVGDESIITVIEVDDIDPPPVQSRKSRGVLLASVEDQQFLRYAWNRPSPPETAALERWIESVWTGSNHPDCVISLACWLAVNTGHSLRTVLTLEISRDLKDDWSLSPADWSLMRRPPKRYSSWSATADHQRWLRHRADVIQIHPPQPAREILASLAERVQGQIETLADLLPDAERIEGRFNEICKATPGLERLLSGMLKHQLVQRAFDQSKDATLAQLVASHPRSGLPGNCAYAAFSAMEVKRALQGSVRVNAASDSDQPAKESNAAGTELDPIDQLLCGAFRSAWNKVQNCGGDPVKWIEHHNTLVSYCIAALLSATGARPVSSPFESLRQFDFDLNLIFVDDKHTNAQHQGRVIPLVAAASNLVKNIYLPHLHRLADIIERQHPTLSKRIRQLSQSDTRQEMPLFFFLASVPTLSWVEVSETSLNATEVFDWPLPWNLMRHRLSTRLRRLGAHQEIVDGILGHSEQGTASYGFFSSRKFGDDVQQVRPLLESLYGELGIEMPKQPTWRIELADPVVVEINKETSERSSSYGSQGRRERRQHDHAQVRRAAIFEIEEFVNTKPLDAISRSDWDLLSKSMLVQRNGMPHPLGGLRYQTLQDWINERWSEKASRPNLKRRYLPVLEEPSPFNELSVGAASIADCVRQAIESLKDVHISRLSLKPARILGCLSLIADARITDRLLIQDVATAKNVRLVALDDQIYLEHGVGLHQWPEAPVRRFWIPAHTARWLDRSWDTRSKLDLSKPFPTSLLSCLFESAGLDPQETAPLKLLEHVCKVIGQENTITLPSYVASYLGGQVMSAALHHQDWIRAIKGQAVTFEQDDDSEVSPANATNRVTAEADEDLEACVLDPQEDFTFNTSVILPAITESQGQHREANRGTTTKDSGMADATNEQVDEHRLQKTKAQQSSHLFFKSIRSAINRHGKKASSPRRDLDAALRNLIAEATNVSPTCRLLGEWTRSLLWRRTPKGLLRLSSVDRYLNALSSCFEAEAHDHNLFDADAEDLTDLYARLLEARRLSRVSGSTSSNGPSDDDQERSSESYRTWKLAANLLRDFHRMCARELSLEDPDWSEFMGAEVPLSISPGILLEKEYLHALEVLVGDAVHASFEALAPAFMLLLTYRFGLRGKEAAGLMRPDWVTTQGGPVVVLVRSNRLRVLKTNASRRQVPLLFKLTDHEQTIIERFTALWHGISGVDDKVPLFCNPARPLDTLDDVKIRSDLARLIKQVSCNQSLSLHHARHTFANQVARLLLNDAGGCWEHVATNPVDEQQAKHVRSLLLSTHEVTRRSSWALARLLGHAHPHTTFRSYLHLFPDISTKLVRSKQRQDDAPVRMDKLSSVRDLNRVVVVAGYLEKVELTPLPRPPITMQSLLRFLFLFQQGSSMDAAAASTGLPSGIAQELIDELDRVDQMLASRPAINPLLGGRSRLLSHISSTRWKYWIDRAAGVSTVINPDEIDRPSGTAPLHLPIGPTRQVLLYRSEHFAMLRQVIDLWGLTPSDFKVAATRQLHPMVTQWARDHGFELTSVEHIKVDGTALQIDSVSEGTPPMSVKHRCALLHQSHAEARIRSSFEVVFLVLAGTSMLGRAAPLSTTKTSEQE
ncbi:hypothetical protein [Hydrogenophaga sp.]|uniref:hypothetical protein n=1 Tax=Hydrogenophaga sp. TaxID=1904254 RepID=UPI0035B376EB